MHTVRLLRSHKLYGTEKYCCLWKLWGKGCFKWSKLYLIASEPLYLKLVETIKRIPCNLSYTKQYWTALLASKACHHSFFSTIPLFIDFFFWTVCWQGMASFIPCKTIHVAHLILLRPSWESRRKIDVTYFLQFRLTLKELPFAMMFLLQVSFTQTKQ